MYPLEKKERTSHADEMQMVRGVSFIQQSMDQLQGIMILGVNCELCSRYLHNSSKKEENQ